ncbi:YegP family protein [uncultured Maribacter sp.]|uniref:YegP family protein n=1 Tax=uncultured Maribacter sp. TaxID=431308 RepID=UPI002635F99D|nr:YegP family protein [uncultured Maribacter sp.]
MVITIKKDVNNKYTFNLKAKSGSILLNSITFNDKVEATKTVNNLKSKNEKELVFERKTNFDGKFLFNLKNKKGQLIGSSKLYDSEAGLENGINNTKESILSIP